MLLHVNPNLNLVHLAEDAAQKVSNHWAKFRKQLPGHELFYGETFALIERRFAEAATPAVIELALLASDFIDGRRAERTVSPETL